VSLGTVDAYFGDLAVSTWYVEESGISNLKVAGIYEPENLQDFNYAFGVRKDYPELVSILNKGLHAIPPDKRGEIFRKWISPTLTRPAINQKTLIIIEGIIGLLIIITILFIIWNRTLKRIVDTKTQDLKAELAEHKKTADILQMTRFTVDHSHAMMLWFDKNGMIRDVNETICIKSGYQRHELIGSHISLLEKGLKQEELNTDITYIEKDGRRIRETTLRFHDGAVIPVLIMLWNFTFENDDWLYAEIEDISQKIEYEKSVRDSEEKYRGLFHHVNDAIILFGIDDTVPGMILDANEAAEIMTGYQHDELCLMPYVHLGIALHPSIRELDPPGCTSRRFTFEWEIITATAEIIPVEVNLHIFEQEGVKFGLSLIRDVTERKRFEIEREASINQIQKNLAELSLLNDGIRNPLSVILGTAEIYCEDGFPLIEKQVLRVDEMIRQLDQRWNESEKILNFLKKHHGIVIQKTEEQDGSLDH
jgi:PAS domain S-box-containing protein